MITEDSYLLKKFQTANTNLENAFKCKKFDTEMTIELYNSSLYGFYKAALYEEAKSVGNHKIADQISVKIMLCFRRLELINYRSDSTDYIFNRLINYYSPPSGLDPHVNIPILALIRKSSDPTERFKLIRQVSTTKSRRIQAEKDSKLLRWHIDIRKKEYVDQLKVQMRLCFKETACELLFNPNFRYQIKALNTLKRVLNTRKHEVVDNLDLILKWLTLKFLNINTLLVLKAIDYMLELFRFLKSVNYTLLDYEADCILPYLIRKLSDPRLLVRQSIHHVLVLITDIYDPLKLLNHLLRAAKTVNVHLNLEVLEHIGILIKTYGLERFNPPVLIETLLNQMMENNMEVCVTAMEVLALAKKMSEDIIKVMVDPEVNELISKSTYKFEIDPYVASNMKLATDVFSKYLIKDMKMFNHLIVNILNFEVDICITCLLMIDVLMREEATKACVVENLDKIIFNCVNRLQVAIHDDYKTETCQSLYIFELIEVITKFLRDIFTIGLGKKASKNCVKLTAYNLIQLITEEEKIEKEFLKKMLRSTLYTMVKEADHFISFRSLFELVREYQEQKHAKYNTGFTKVLAEVIRRKIRKFFTNTNSDDIYNQLDVNQILIHLDSILYAFPRSTWTPDSPLNVIQDFLDALTKAKLNQVIDDLNTIDIRYQLDSDIIQIVSEILEALTQNSEIQN